LVDERNYAEAIRIYNAARPKLEKIKDFQSVAGIYADSRAIIERLERLVSFNISIFLDFKF
jgi:hypothetical protein